MALAFGLLAYILIAGDTAFLLNMAINSIGHTLQNTIAMLFWTDPIDNTGFVKDWTLFYWAWWIAYGPFMGIFVARISGGRSLRGSARHANPGVTGRLAVLSHRR